jgi:hypothetical protein
LCSVAVNNVNLPNFRDADKGVASGAASLGGRVQRMATEILREKNLVFCPQQILNY